jgi:hypothetical protein
LLNIFCFRLFTFRWFWRNHFHIETGLKPAGFGAAVSMADGVGSGAGWVSVSGFASGASALVQ